jgi:D-alanyl-D-alanine dipeptidase
VENKTVPPVHTTGGAVDLTVIDAQGAALNMGTAFDDFSPAAHTAYYENRRLLPKDAAIRDHRRLLYNAMTAVGFTSLPSEWWHYDFGDRFWGYYKRKPAVYSGVFDLEELYANQE